jgi:hypothetical protein
VQAIAASLATSQLRHCSSNLDIEDFVELCPYRPSKLQELVVKEVLDPQPINGRKLFLLEHNCAVTYVLNLPALFGHTALGYTSVRKV